MKSPDTYVSCSDLFADPSLVAQHDDGRSPKDSDFDVTRVSIDPEGADLSNLPVAELISIDDVCEAPAAIDVVDPRPLPSIVVADNVMAAVVAHDVVPTVEANGTDTLTSSSNDQLVIGNHPTGSAVHRKVTRGKRSAGNSDRIARLIRRPEVQHLIGLSRSSLYRLIEAGEFPKPIQLAPGSVGWIEGEVLAWIAERIESTRNGSAVKRPPPKRK